MSENLRKLLNSSSSTISSVGENDHAHGHGVRPHPKLSKFHVNLPQLETQKQDTLSTKWVPIVDRGSNSYTRQFQLKPSHLNTPKTKSDLKVFEVKFPSGSSINAKKDNQFVKPVTFQLIPIKQLQCVSIDKEPQEVVSKCETKMLRPGSGRQGQANKENGRSRMHVSPRLSKKLEKLSRNNFCNIDRENEDDLNPNLGAFAFYDAIDKANGFLPGQVDILEGGIDGETNTDIWFDRFSKSLGAAHPSKDYHQVPEFAMREFDELEKMFNLSPGESSVMSDKKNPKRLPLLKRKRKSTSPNKIVGRKSTTHVSQLQSYLQGDVGSCRSKLFRRSAFDIHVPGLY